LESVTFTQEATLINNPTGKTIAGTFSMSEISFTNLTLTSGNLFLFAGTYTKDPSDGTSGFKIDNIEINEDSLSGATNKFISLTGSFIQLNITNILLNKATCNDMSLVYLAPSQVTNATLSTWTI